MVHDELTRDSVVSLAGPAGNEQLDDEATEAPWALAGACPAKKATSGM